ncbi:hypothetical protein [Streptomyces canus]|uniref:hypothetical protein n=1 Tax=Streptomyces canus TaxID=58343 RepID=UPI00324436A0
MILFEFGELCRAGLFGREAGDRVDGLRLDLAGLAAGAAALDLHGLDGVREEQAGLDGADLQTADLAAAVAGPGGAVLQGLVGSMSRQRTSRASAGPEVQQGGELCHSRAVAGAVHARHLDRAQDPDLGRVQVVSLARIRLRHGAFLDGVLAVVGLGSVFVRGGSRGPGGRRGCRATVRGATVRPGDHVLADADGVAAPLTRLSARSLLLASGDTPSARPSRAQRRRVDPRDFSGLGAPAYRRDELVRHSRRSRG